VFTRSFAVTLILLTAAGCSASPAPPTTPLPTAAPSGSTASPAAVVTADVDGDGVADSISQHMVKGVWQLDVVTASGSYHYHRSPADEVDVPSPVEVAALDPAPGAEIIFPDLMSDDLRYVVLTWRDGGLVEAPNPAGSSKRWVTGDEFAIYTGYTFVTVNGQPLLTTSETGLDQPAKFVQYGWVSGAWVSQRTWTEELDQAAKDALCHSFCGVDIQPLADI
jgi:hypothetical protein